jgi:hypothetical protein
MRPGLGAAAQTQRIDNWMNEELNARLRAEADRDAALHVADELRSDRQQARANWHTTTTNGPP